ncbi:MAG: EAL domain-containing protein [Alphaproteobacteria bacterium]|nr:EAL domain-containing protein [Alphaproteobacteria bacterium]
MATAAIIPAPIAPAAPREMPRDLDDDTVLAIMREGLRADRVDLFVQPVVSLPQRKRRFFEAFTRIRTEDGAVVLPDQYIALAEREGLVPTIDNLLLFRCVQLLRKTQRKSDGLGFFCNISPHTIADRTFFRDFVDFMGENAQLAPRLFFELPQSTLLGADADLAQALKRLGAAGFRFSMDQVSHLDLEFADLAERHVRFVKVDAGLVLAALADPDKAAAVRALKKRVARFGIDLVVAKIETETMLRELLDLEIDYGQGYLFGEPRPGAEAPL